MRDTDIPNHIRLSAFMASIPDHVYFKDRDSRFVWVGESLARSLGRSTREVVGLTDADFFDDTRARAYRRAELEILTTGTPVVDHVVEQSARAWSPIDSKMLSENGATVTAISKLRPPPPSVYKE